MKRIFIQFSFLLLLGYFFANTQSVFANQNCLSFSVSVNVVQGVWPGGSIGVSCEGSRVPGPNHCVGSSGQVNPNSTVQLVDCDCHYNGGCMHVGGAPSQCHTLSVPACGRNPENIQAQILVMCDTPTPPPPTITNTPPPPSATQTPVPPPPGCGQACTPNGVCQPGLTCVTYNGGNICAMQSTVPACIANPIPSVCCTVPTNTPSPTPVSPTPTTPFNCPAHPPVACGDCHNQNGVNGCACTDYGNGCCGLQCPNPTATPTPAVPGNCVEAGDPLAPFSPNGQPSNPNGTACSSSADCNSGWCYGYDSGPRCRTCTYIPGGGGPPVCKPGVTQCTCKSGNSCIATECSGGAGGGGGICARADRNSQFICQTCVAPTAVPTVPPPTTIPNTHRVSGQVLTVECEKPNFCPSTGFDGLDGVVVSLTGTNNYTATTAVGGSGQHGAFYIYNVPDGLYNLCVSQFPANYQFYCSVQSWQPPPPTPTRAPFSSQCTKILVQGADVAGTRLVAQLSQPICLIPTATPVPPTNTPVPPTNTPVPTVPAATVSPSLTPNPGACTVGSSCNQNSCGGDIHSCLVCGNMQCSGITNGQCICSVYISPTPVPPGVTINPTVTPNPGACTVGNSCNMTSCGGDILHCAACGNMQCSGVNNGQCICSPFISPTSTPNPGSTATPTPVIPPTTCVEGQTCSNESCTANGGNPAQCNACGGFACSNMVNGIGSCFCGATPTATPVQPTATPTPTTTATPTPVQPTVEITLPPINTHTQTSSTTGAASTKPALAQRWFCLEAKPCTDALSGCAVYPDSTVDADHRVRITNKPDVLPLPNTKTYVFECIQTPQGQLCTTGSQGLDNSLGITDIAILTNPQNGYQYEFRGFYLANGVAAANNPVTSDAQGHLAQYEWESHTKDNIGRIFVGMNEYDPSMYVGSNPSQQQAIMQFAPNNKKCIMIKWDPRGVVYNSSNNQPLSDVKITLLQKNDDGTFAPLSASDILGGIKNPIYTDQTGKYSFFVPDGIYKITAEKPGFIFPAVNTTGSIDPTLYRGEEIEQKGKQREFNIPMAPDLTYQIRKFVGTIVSHLHL